MPERRQLTKNLIFCAMAWPGFQGYGFLAVSERRRSKIIPASLLLEAYCSGIFPMAMENGDIAWFSPDPRGIIPLDAFHIPHGLKRILKKEEFQIRLNTALAEAQ